MGARLNHGLRPAWLLRQPGSPAMVHAAVHRGAWKSATGPTSSWPTRRDEVDAA